jgi:hypothetical protein
MISGAQNNLQRLFGMRPSGFRVGPLNYENTRLPIAEAKEMGDVSTIMAGIDRTQNKFEQSQPYVRTPVAGQIASYLPWTEAAEAKAAVVPAMQNYGKFMEDGVLREADERKYTKIFPQVGEPKELVQFKSNLMRRMLVEQYNGRLSAFEKAGYDVSEFEPMELPPEPVVSKAFQKQADEVMAVKKSLNMGRGVYRLPDGGKGIAKTPEDAIMLQTLGAKRIE